MRFLLDSNILLRTLEPEHTHHRDGTEAIDILQRLGHEPVIVPQVLYELWSVATRPAENNGIGLTTVQAHAHVEMIKQLFRLMRDERGVCEEWERLVVRFDVKGKKSHDARLVAAMIRHRISHILTFNVADFSRYPLISTLVPSEVVKGTFSI